MMVFFRVAFCSGGFLSCWLFTGWRKSGWFFPGGFCRVAFIRDPTNSHKLLYTWLCSILSQKASAHGSVPSGLYCGCQKPFPHFALTLIRAELRPLVCLHSQSSCHCLKFQPIQRVRHCVYFHRELQCWNNSSPCFVKFVQIVLYTKQHYTCQLVG